MKETEMTGLGDRAEGAALWQRWRQLSQTASPYRIAPDPLVLAAYAEGRLDEHQAEPVEDWLADHPEAFEDLAAAREGADPASAPAAAIARAQALVTAADPKIVPFPVARRGGWRAAVAWSGIAASLLVTSLFGFALGSNAYLGISGANASSDSAVHELLDPPGGLFSTDDEDQAI
jgi:anti-sigma factor RsiW